MRLRAGVSIATRIVLSHAAAASAADCDRACLRAIVTQYLEAFVAHQPNAAFTPGFKYVQDRIDTKPGDGLWKETAKLRPYPRTWAGPWTVAFPLARTPEYGMFEYACHEGNHGLLNALSGSRAEEKAQ